MRHVWRRIRTVRGSGALALLAIAIAIAFLWLRASPAPEEQYRSVLALLRNGEFERAAQQARDAGSRYSGSGAPWSFRFRLLEAEALIESGKTAPAMALLDSSPAVTDPEYHVVHRLLKVARSLATSSFTEANALMAEAREIAERAGRKDLYPELDLRSGQLLGRQRKFVEAEQAYERARAAAQQSGDYWRVASAWNGLGMLSVVRAKYDAAIPKFEQAEKIWTSIDARHSVAGAVNNLGLCYTQLGDFDRALEYRRRAESLARPSVLLANIMGEAGTLHLYQQNYEEAVSNYRRARDMAAEFGRKSDAARWAGNLALTLASRQDWEEAEKALNQALALNPEPRSRPFLDVNAGIIAHGRGRTEEARAIFERTIATPNQSAAVLWQAHAALANLAASAGNIPQANASFERAIAVIENSRSDLSRDEHRLTFLSRLIRFYQDYVDTLVRQNDPVRAHAVADASRARLLIERMPGVIEGQRPHTAADFQKVARQSGSIWLSYWLGRSRSFLWVTTPTQVRLFTLPPAAEITRLVEEYRGFIEVAMRDPLQAPNEAGRRLYDVLIAPAAPLIPADSKLIIVPDAALHQLAFDTLPIYASGHAGYLMDNLTVAIAPSFGVYRPAGRPSLASASALLIGDPTSPSSAYPPLPHTAAEITALSNRFERNAVIRGAAAKPAAYAASEPGRYNIVHFAAHAEANRQNPLESAIILSPSERGFRLSTRELMNLPLQSELVTLSACRSSGSRAYGGEGFVGLAWAFLHAGARSVVAGLWNVADQSTASLMDRMYAAIESGSSPCDALHSAKLDLRKTSWSKPYYWGSFQCYVR